MTVPAGFHCVIPSRLAVGEPFSVRVRVLGEPRPIPARGQWNTWKPRLHGPFNRNVERRIQYLDNCLPEWQGRLALAGCSALSGPRELTFDGVRQGAFPGDTRPIATFSGFRWTQPGFRFVEFTDPVSGVAGTSNPVFVSPDPPSERLYWGDPHWQTYFSDGIRCPEELYAFAREEAFLDFGAITDHVEAVTDRQWDYFVAVTNDYNQAGRFATLVGLEWTKHHPGHRNVYYRGDTGPVLRSTDPRFDSLPRLWAALQGLDAIAIPHHTSNTIMGVDWSHGWNPAFEKAVEIYSVWGSSECPADEGNSRPIRHCRGEMKGRHVRDALRAGFRLGFVGGGDIHDGRPGDAHSHCQPETASACEVYPQGLTAVMASELSREAVYDAMAARRTYATTHSRVYLDALPRRQARGVVVRVRAASEDGVDRVVLVRKGEDAATVVPDQDPRVLQADLSVGDMAGDDSCYVRVHTAGGNMAWSSPFWGDEV